MSFIVSPVEAPGKRKEILHGVAPTTTSGTLAATVDCDGFTISKVATEAGRYLITLLKGYNQVSCYVTVEFTAADAVYTTTKAAINLMRNVSLANKTFHLQMVDKAFADAEVEDGATLHITIVARRGVL